MMDIDGSEGSGSGTIVRLSLAFAALTEREIRITNIRSKRPNPGLRHQHLEVARTIAKICNASLEGDHVGSTDIKFHPGKIHGGIIDVEIATAGSIGLLAYAVLIPSIFADEPVVLRIHGGSTASMWSPPVEYLNKVFLPILRLMGIEAKFIIQRHGFYPKGGALVEFSVKPSRPQPIEITELGEMDEINSLSVASVSLSKAKVAERQTAEIQRILGEHVKSENKYVESLSPSSFVLIYARTKSAFLGSDSIGEKGKPAEVVGEEAALRFQDYLKYSSPLDEHAADMLIPFISLAPGRSAIVIPSLSDHVKTNIWLCEKFLGAKFNVKEEGENYRIICEGSSI